MKFEFNLKSLIVFVFLMLASFVYFQQSAYALEHRKVAGKYEFVVGFLTDPAFAGQMNAAVFLIKNPSARNNRPIFGLEQSLKGTIIFADKTLPVELKPLSGEPGAYAGYFLPTRTGKYIFRVEGTIEGSIVNEQFESSDVLSSNAIQFPEKLDGLPSGEIHAINKKPNQIMLIAFAGILLSIVALVIAFLCFLSQGKKVNLPKP